MRFKIILIAVSVNVVIWLIAYFKAPRLQVRFVDWEIEPMREHFWVDWRSLKDKGLKQLNITLEVTNHYDKDINLFGVYSKNLEQLSLQSSLFNNPGQRPISSKETVRFTIYYLLKEEVLLNSINIRKDFLVYSCFSGETSFITVEKSWQEHPVVAPLFGIGYSRIH